MNEVLEHYVRAVTRMRTAAGKKQYPADTRHRAPHKPILLLSIFDQFDQGEITRNFVPFSAELADLFASYWDLVMPVDRTPRMFLPFFHMKNDGFWQLLPQPGKEAILEAIPQIAGTAQLRDTVLGGQFDEDLYQLILIKEHRDVLRTAVIKKYFADSIQRILMQQAEINVTAYQYSQNLLETARKRSAHSDSSAASAEQPVRDQGFRRAIVTAYDHRCVLCGVRLVTYEGRTSATAAHIIPWSVSYNDDPRNGLCLCRLCHWTFDVGLTAITTRYRIRLSDQINNEGNMPGYLSTLADRPIFEPTEDVFNPDPDALQWHMKQVFLG